MTQSRLSLADLAQRVRDLPPRYTTPLLHLHRARLLTGAHLDRLLSDPDTTSHTTTARIRRRIMTRLADLGLVTTLARTVGGARAGSTGHIYTLTPTGYRVLALLQGQPRPPRRRITTPGTLFLTHMLMISSVYVSLIHANRQHSCQVATFISEPECWWPTGHAGDYLKPDAYLVLATAAHQDCWWLEVDQATESLPRIRTKCRAYLDYLTHGGTGPDHVAPRVLYSTPTTQRAQDINKIITQLSTQDTNLLNVTTHTNAHTLLIKELLTT